MVGMIASPEHDDGVFRSASKDGIKFSSRSVKSYGFAIGGSVRHHPKTHDGESTFGRARIIPSRLRAHGLTADEFRQSKNWIGTDIADVYGARRVSRDVPALLLTSHRGFIYQEASHQR